MILYSDCVGGVALVDDKASKDEKQELVEIYGNLSHPLREQLLTLARVINTTRDITLNEKRLYNKKNKNNKGEV